MKKIAICFLVLVIASASYATMPVIDYTQVAKTVQIVRRLNDQYNKMKQQYEMMTNQYYAMTGSSGWGDFKNAASILQKKRKWAPKDWQSALQGLSGGNPDRYQQLLSAYKKDHDMPSEKDYLKGSDALLSRSYGNQVKTNQASSAQASYEFNNINEHLSDLSELSHKIEDGKKNHDIKSSMDLNSRILVEVGFVSVEELRMQALLNQQFAQIQAARISQEAQLAQFNSEK